MEKSFVPKRTDSEKLESIKSQRESIKKILQQLDKEESQLIRGNRTPTDVSASERSKDINEKSSEEEMIIKGQTKNEEQPH